MRWLLAILIGLASFSQSSEARACSCMKLTPAEGLSSAYAVFIGEVTKIEPNTATKFGGIEITLRVSKVWKGEVGEQVKVRTAGTSAACGYRFVEGERYLVYADRDEADPMRVSLCSRTALVANAGQDLDFLGKPTQELGDASARSKKKDRKARRRDNCSASTGPGEHTAFGWVLLSLAGAALALRRIA